jgi:hypothetical protein
MVVDAVCKATPTEKMTHAIIIPIFRPNLSPMG